MGKLLSFLRERYSDLANTFQIFGIEWKDIKQWSWFASIPMIIQTITKVWEGATPSESAVYGVAMFALVMVILAVIRYLLHKKEKRATKLSSSTQSSPATSSPSPFRFTGDGRLIFGFKEPVGKECPFCGLNTFHCISPVPAKNNNIGTGLFVLTVPSNRPDPHETWHCISCKRQQERRDI